MADTLTGIKKYVRLLSGTAEVSSTNRLPISSDVGLWATATFTPAAAAYSANDVMDVAKTFTWVDKNGTTFAGGIVMILTADLLISETAVQSGETSYNLQKYNITPPSARADNAAWDLASGDRASYQRATSLGTPVDIGSSLYVSTSGINEPILVPSTGLTFAELVTVAAFTATATARKVTLFGVPL